MRTVSSDEIAERLQRKGFLKDVAGADFPRVVFAVCQMYAKGKGLLLTGEAGCGKTALMEALRQIMGKDRYNWYYCLERADLRSLRCDDSDALNDTVFVDDIGAEEVVKEYGNTIDIVGNFIQLYHYRGKGRFLATTNLNSAQINEKYGGRILDRLLEMCVVLKFNGKTKRERTIVK